MSISRIKKLKPDAASRARSEALVLKMAVVQALETLDPTDGGECFETAPGKRGLEKIKFCRPYVKPKLSDF